MNLRDHLLEQGRHNNVTVLSTSHIARDGNATKYPIRDSRYLVAFPRGNSMQTESLLDGYFKQAKKNGIKEEILNTPDRWILIHQHSPNYVLTKRGGILLR